MNNIQNAIICDTTLRDGEQSPGIAFTTEDKVAIAEGLYRAGIREIEVGTPAIGPVEQGAIEAIIERNLPVRCIGWNRGVIPDIRKSLECGLKSVAISLPTSDLHLSAKLGKSRDWAIHQIQAAVTFAKEHGCYVILGGEDSSRADLNHLIAYVQAAQKAGADRFRFCDTVGILDPFTTYEKVAILRGAIDIPIEIHAHNDFGMALANSVAGVRAGAAYISTTIDGIGERAGNACLQDVLRLAASQQNHNAFRNILYTRKPNTPAVRIPEGRSLTMLSARIKGRSSNSTYSPNSRLPKTSLVAT